MLTSAGGILALLQDNPDVKQGVSTDDQIRLKVQLTQFALRKLDVVVDEFWAEISDSIQNFEVSAKYLVFKRHGNSLGWGDNFRANYNL